MAPKREPEGQNLQKTVSKAYHAAPKTANKTINFMYHKGLTLRLLPPLKWLSKSCKAPKGQAQPQKALPKSIP